MRRSLIRRLFPDGWWTLLFLGPYLLGFCVFIAYPVLFSLAGSFTKWPIFGGPTFSGLENYRKLAVDAAFWRAALNTVYYVLLLVPGEIAAALGLAVLVNRTWRGNSLFRAVYFMPFVLSLAAIGLVWTWLYSPDFGLINQVIKLLGGRQVQWLTEPALAMPALVIASIWRNAGYYMVMFLAGLQNVPAELYEAARIDGAGPWQQFRHITWPLLTPVTFLAVIIGVILGFQVFDLTYVMTQGGPAGATVTLLFFVYTRAFQKGDLGYASAAAFVMALLLIGFTAVYFRLQRRWVHYQG